MLLLFGYYASVTYINKKYLGVIKMKSLIKTIIVSSIGIILSFLLDNEFISYILNIISCSMLGSSIALLIFDI